MAQRTITIFTDDIEGGEAPATQTITFALDGISYVIDLNDLNATRLRHQFSTWTTSARAGSGGGGRRASARGGRAASPTPGQNAAVREWARSNGYEIGDRGRISEVIRQAYSQAHR